MRETVIIVILCLLFGQASCSRRKAQGSGQSNQANVDVRTTEGAKTEAKTQLEKGKEYYRSDEDEKAALAFQEAINLDPDLAEAYFRLGLAQEALGKEQEAEETFKKAVTSYKKYLEQNGDDAEAHYNLGQTYAGLGLYSEAIREYRQATRLKQDDADIYYDLGAALTKLAQYDEAAAAFTKSLEIDPDNYRAQDALEEAREGVKRIRAGKKHQEDLLKKQKEDELKKQQEQGGTPAPASTKPATTKTP
jgi:tetratricopeptide (TPR) repeat protein